MTAPLGSTSTCPCQRAARSWASGPGGQSGSRTCSSGGVVGYAEPHRLTDIPELDVVAAVDGVGFQGDALSKVSETDRSALSASGSNQITLYTCVRDEREFRPK